MRLSSVGVAKPVQPSSSKMPPTKVPTIPSRRRAPLSLVVSMVGRYSGELSERAKSAAVTRSGAVRSAMAYQCAPTLHLVTLVRRSRRHYEPYSGDCVEGKFSELYIQVTA